MADAEDLPDFEEDEHKEEKDKENGDAKKASQAGMHASGFKDFLLKPELLRAIVDCGFEHPSEVQHECIPQAILGTDVLCQAKSGMGKTAVFVLACLQQIDSSEKAVRTMVVCHTRELAYQIKQEFERFSKYFPGVKSAVVYGGTPMSTDKEMLKDNCPHILIGTPGRVLALLREKDLKLDKLQHFVLDECDKCLDKIDMRKDVQSIFMESPKKKQVMMFSATMSAETRALCKKFMTEPHEIRVDEESKLTLHGLLQYYVKLTEKEKNRKLNDLLDALEFNQVVIFVKSVQRAVALDKLLVECNFPSIAIHSGLQQDERIARYKQFKEFQKRILVATDLFATLGGRSGSNACTFIALYFGHLYHHKNLPPPVHSSLSMEWKCALHKAITKGNEIHDELFEGEGVDVAVVDAVDMAGTECFVQSIGQGLDMFGMDCVDQLAQVFETLSFSATVQSSCGVIVTTGRSFLFIANQDGSCMIVDSHRHGNNTGALIGYCAPNYAKVLAKWFESMFQETWQSNLRVCSVTPVFYSTP